MRRIATPQLFAATFVAAQDMLDSCDMSNLPADAAEAVDTNVDGHDSIGCFDSSNDEK